MAREILQAFANIGEYRLKRNKRAVCESLAIPETPLVEKFSNYIASVSSHRFSNTSGTRKVSTRFIDLRLETSGSASLSFKQECGIDVAYSQKESTTVAESISEKR